MAEEFTIKDKVCVVGIGETEFTKAGAITRSEFQLACEAIIKAVDDAGLKITDIEGICSYLWPRGSLAASARAWLPEQRGPPVRRLTPRPSVS